jgi:site-specific DNA-methyltransferase (adenine-specific)
VTQATAKRRRIAPAEAAGERALPLDEVLAGDSIKLIESLPDESVHLILSDIPYGIGAENWDVLHTNTNSAYLGASPAQARAGAVFKKRGKPINGWSEADRAIPREYYEWCLTWAPEWLRVLKPGGLRIAAFPRWRIPVSPTRICSPGCAPVRRIARNV